jgi:hypothetical protein
MGISGASEGGRETAIVAAHRAQLGGAENLGLLLQLTSQRGAVA